MPLKEGIGGERRPKDRVKTGEDRVTFRITLLYQLSYRMQLNIYCVVGFVLFFLGTIMKMSAMHGFKKALMQLSPLVTLLQNWKSTNSSSALLP